MKKFPATTFGAYRPGHGITLTRANVTAIQKDLTTRGNDPLSPEQMVRFCDPKSETEGKKYSRMLKRARKVMTGPIRESVNKKRVVVKKIQRELTNSFKGRR